MKLRIWIKSFFFVGLILQITTSSEEGPKANLTALQEKVEKLIETVMVAIQEYYQQSENEYKCLSEKYTDELMNAVKDGIDCVERNHKEFQEGRIDLQDHRKEFLRCFEKAKNAVEYVLQHLDPADNNCPSEKVEKTFQINITTSYTKTFNLNIQNGVDVSYNKTIQVTRNEEPCRNYPDIFSFDDRPGRNQELTTNRGYGILHHNPGGGIGYNRLESQDGATGELTTPRISMVSTPTFEHFREEPKGEVVYAYFQGFQSGDDAKSRQEQPGDPDILRKIRNPVSKERAPEVTA